MSYKDKLFKGLCRIKNYGANCYLNSGLQIISRCSKFIDYLKNNDFPKDIYPFCNILKYTIDQILNKDYLDPNDFIEYFSKNNSEFPRKSQNCSQLFIRTVLLNVNNEIKKKDIVNIIEGYSPKNIDEKISYKEFLNNNIIFPQSLPYSYFSGIIKTESTGNCNKCGEVKKYSFMDFFDQHM